MNGDGCGSCREWLGKIGNGELVEVADCADSFKRINEYFSAQLFRCPRCESIWLVGYHEDFTDVAIEDEWGKRTWIYRTLSPEQIAEIDSAKGAQTLDISTFAT